MPLSKQSSERKAPDIWKGQLWHLIFLSVLLYGAWSFWLLFDRQLGLYFWLTISIPVTHQVFVWLTWRLELENGGPSRIIGFNGYLVIFFVLLISRPLSIGILAYQDINSLGMSALPRWTITALLLMPALYLGYSVRKYFTFIRAAGADHFDSSYRDMPLVREGIFKYTSNAMYLFGFMALWAIAIGFNSKMTIVAAGFNHLYIWVHYFCTERPDMRYLYG